MAKVCDNCGSPLPNAVGVGLYCTTCGEPVSARRPRENPETTRLRALSDQLRAQAAELRSTFTPEMWASLTDEQRAILAEDLMELRRVSSRVMREIEAHLDKGR